MRKTVQQFIKIFLCGIPVFMAGESFAKPGPPAMVVTPAVAMHATGPVFALAGKTCPLGSKAYKGPAAKLSAGSGFIYCELEHNVNVFNKKDFKSCPPGQGAYNDPKAVPDDDVIWCERVYPVLKAKPAK